MCGKCEVFLAKIGCGSIVLGFISMLLAVITKLMRWAPMHVGPRSFAAGAALLLLFAIATHSCQSVCHTEAEGKKD